MEGRKTGQYETVQAFCEMSALAHFGFPHEAIPPLEVTVRRRRSAQGDRFLVSALDEQGRFSPIINDDFGQPIRFISAECARRQFYRLAGKWMTQMTVIYRSDWED